MQCYQKIAKVLFFFHIIIVVSNVNNIILMHIFHIYSCTIPCISILPFSMNIGVPQSLTLLHPHFTSSLQTLEDTGNVPHTGSQDWLFLSNVQPGPSGVCVCG